jgi:hypothetical protein
MCLDWFDLLRGGWFISWALKKVAVGNQSINQSINHLRGKRNNRGEKGR